MKITKIIIGLGFIGAVSGLGYFFFQGGTLSDITDMVSKDTVISDAELSQLYADSRPQLIAGYKKGDNKIANEYETWQEASTIPANPGVHSSRYMMTYVNKTGHSTYTQYGTQNVKIPVGTKIAKESFMVKGDNRFSPSPLFTMEKVGLDKAPETNGWVYERVNRNGRKMITSQKFCHACHDAFKHQDSLGYPVKKARLGHTPNAPKVSLASLGAGDAANGETIFDTCASCHNIGADAKNAFGPVLTGVTGRQAGSYPGYKYSSSLKAAKDKGLIWDEQSLFAWLEEPSEFLKDYLGEPTASSKMPLGFEDPNIRNDVIAFLKLQSTHTKAE